MPICPYCQLLNPQHHNFCQDCGKSLKHYLCRSCGHDVEFDAENCPQCQASSGTYWWAIIEPTAVESITKTDDEFAVDDRQLDSYELLVPISAELGLSSNPLEFEISGNLWDRPVAVLEPVDRQPEELLVPTLDSDDLAINPWDRSADLAGNSPNGEESAVSSTDLDASATFEAVIHGEPLVATTYLDPQCNYRLLDPVALQLLKAKSG
jgi:protein phosphatase